MKRKFYATLPHKIDAAVEDYKKKQSIQILRSLPATWKKVHSGRMGGIYVGR